MQHGQEEDAGIDRPIADRIADQFTQRDRASAAIALCAALLGAGQAFLLAEPFKNRLRRINAFKRPDASVHYKADHALRLHSIRVIMTASRCLVRGGMRLARHLSSNAAVLFESAHFGSS